MTTRETKLIGLGAGAGAAHPPASMPGIHVTCAPDGGSASSALDNAAPATAASQVGGSRSTNFKLVEGRRTLPAAAVGGRPSAPTTATDPSQAVRSACSATPSP